MSEPNTPERGDDDVGLPRSAIDRVLQEVLPPNMCCTKDTKNLLIECSTEFISIVSAQANELCERDSRKTVTPEHILQALGDLGFESYIQEVTEKYALVREEHTKRQLRAKEKTETKKGLFDNGDEMLEVQKKLFEEAKRTTEKQE
ncbi:MAG: TATA binding protein-associated phosphoprotein [Amphiamblys sp. WSBS2006]|nr:MAG: TATA binding protein-associated phosphoprotein [Amphiamblys sp. WSBS2006]